MNFISWDSFSSFLFIERKIDLSSKQSLHYRFNIIEKWFKENNKDFNKDSVNQFISYLIDIGLMKSTINNYIKMFKNMCRFQKLDFLDEYTYFPSVSPHIDPLSWKDIEKLEKVKLKYARENTVINERYAAVIHTLSVTGMRINELCNLKWSPEPDVLPDRIIIRDSKTNHMRIIMISKYTYDKICNLPRYYHNYVFGSKHGKLCDKKFAVELKRRAVTAGIHKRVFSHIFRHTLITSLVRANIPLSIIQQISGHSSLSSLQSYVHLNIDDQAVALQMNPITHYKPTFEVIKNMIKEFVPKLDLHEKLKLVQWLSLDREQHRAITTLSKLV